MIVPSTANIFTDDTDVMEVDPIEEGRTGTTSVTLVDMSSSSIHSHQSLGM